ncbi:MAG TPA: hypothetical protein VFJ47_05595 [Terriglobales bacterium]|nr:hypothetical protein [Terriglobales bacterium]
MKLMTSFFVAVLLCACLWAQAAAPAQAPSSQAPAAAPAPPMHHGMGPGMHPEHMQEMKAQLAKMHMTLDQMKLNLAKVKDPAAKQQAQLDIDLWQGMVQHLDGMVKMMSDHPMGNAGMGHDGMGHDDMGMQMDCCAGMKDSEHAGGCCGGMKCMQHRTGPASSDLGEKTPK